MDNVNGQQASIVAFFEEVSTRALDYRLALVQRESGNHQLLSGELSNLWQSIRQSYESQAWRMVLAFHDALQPFLDLRGYWTESLALNEWARNAAEALGERVQVARLTHDRADILNQKGEYARAEQLYRSSEASYHALGEMEMALRSRHMCSLVVRAQGQLAEATRLCESTVIEATALGLEKWLAHPLYIRGLLARDQGEFQKAQQSIEESLVRLADPNELAMIAQCQHFLGELALLQNDLGRARTVLEESLRISQQVGIERRVAATQRLLGELARMEGRHQEADERYTSALVTVTRLGDRPQEARLLLSRGQLMSDLAQQEDAISLFRAAVTIYSEVGDARGVTGGFLLLARAYLQQKRVLLGLKMVIRAISAAQKAGLLRPRSLVGFVKRAGKW